MRRTRKLRKRRTRRGGGWHPFKNKEKVWFGDTKKWFGETKSALYRRFKGNKQQELEEDVNQKLMLNKASTNAITGVKGSHVFDDKDGTVFTPQNFTPQNFTPQKNEYADL